jgi:hypothetical protein
VKKNVGRSSVRKLAIILGDSVQYRTIMPSPVFMATLSLSQ